MNRREILKGLLYLPLLPLIKLTSAPTARLDHIWSMTAPPTSMWIQASAGRLINCTVWNRELSQLEVWTIHDRADKQHMDGCICERRVE